MQQAVNTYNRVYVNTSTNKIQMLLDLYEGAIQFIDFAERVMKNRNIAKRGEYISRAIAILTELDNALDRTTGGPIVHNLSGLYGYMIQRLTAANSDKDPAALGEVKNLLEGLLDAWRQAARELDSRTSPLQEQGQDLEPHQRQYGGECVA